MIVLDTNVVSELMRPSPDHSVVMWFAQQPTTDLYISTVSEAELRYGVEILPAGQRRDRKTLTPTGFPLHTSPPAARAFLDCFRTP